jgi:hypothetical protein
LPRRRSEREQIEIGEQCRRAAGVHEDDVVVARPPLLADQRDESGQPLAGVDRLENQRLQLRLQLDRVDRRRVRDAVGRSGAVDITVGLFCLIRTCLTQRARNVLRLLTFSRHLCLASGLLRRGHQREFIARG